jgi:hypothetical protein
MGFVGRLPIARSAIGRSTKFTRLEYCINEGGLRPFMALMIEANGAQRMQLSMASVSEKGGQPCPFTIAVA